MFTEKSKIQAFIAYCRFQKNLAPKTLNAYLRDLLNFHSYEEKYAPKELSQYIVYLLESGKKISTVKRYHASLSQYFKYMCEKYNEDNPMKSVKLRLKSEKFLPRTIALHEMKKLFQILYHQRNAAATSEFEHFEAVRDLALIDLLASTGMRIGEAAAVRLSDLDMREKTLLIHGKGRKERLTYFSCAETIANLKDWLTARKRATPQNDFLFINKYGKPITIYGIENVFSKYKKLSGINPKATPHYLRHTFATNLLANGSDLRTVQEILGHSSIAVTERYTEVTLDRKIKVLKKYNFRNSLF